MCIRDRRIVGPLAVGRRLARVRWRRRVVGRAEVDGAGGEGCLLYTSDAAGGRLWVDLGGRRIIKKKKTDKKDWR